MGCDDHPYPERDTAYDETMKLVGRLTGAASYGRELLKKYSDRGVEISNLRAQLRESSTRQLAEAAPITAEDILAAMAGWDEFAGDDISQLEDDQAYAMFMAEWLNQRAGVD